MWTVAAFHGEFSFLESWPGKKAGWRQFWGKEAAAASDWLCSTLLGCAAPEEYHREFSVPHSSGARRISRDVDI